MSFRDFVAKEIDAAKRELHLDPMEPRTWECSPLLITTTEDAVVFCGPAAVEVNPNIDGTFDLLASVEIDGWRPSLRATTVKPFHGARSRLSDRATRDGLICYGMDENTEIYNWHINGAADDFGIQAARTIHTGGEAPRRTAPKPPATP